MPGSAVQSGSASGARSTRLRLSAAATSSSRACSVSPAAPVRSIALTSMCDASQGAVSPTRPVSTFTTPPGTSEVASTSLSVIAGSGRSADDATITVLPVTITGASTETRPEQGRPLRSEHGDDAGRLGQREVEVRAGDWVRAADHLRDLVRPTGVPDPAVDRGVDDLLRARPGEPLAPGYLVDELGPAALHELGHAVEHLPAVVRGRAGPSRRTPCGRPRRRRGHPCATPVRRWRETGRARR